MQTVFRKWWVILIQGILLIILGIIFFNNPAEVLAVISLWVGILTLITGALGLVAHFMMPNEDRADNPVLWSIATLLLGLLMVSKLGLTMKVVTVIFGIWVLVTGIWLTKAGWDNRRAGSPSWLMILGGILSIIAGIVIIFNIGVGAIWISTLLGLQALTAGIAFIVFAFVKRDVVKNIKDAIS